MRRLVWESGQHLVVAGPGQARGVERSGQVWKVFRK